MKILIATSHFPPDNIGGSEIVVYRMAQALKERGHNIEVVSIKSIDLGTLIPQDIQDTYEGLSVHRLNINLSFTKDRYRYSFQNPEIGTWFRNFLQTNRPDLIHINAGYLLSTTVPQAALDMGIPTIITLHDYWFLCPLFTLLRQDGNICQSPVPEARCVWCLLSEKRRYRIPDIYTKGRLGDLFSILSRSNYFTRFFRVNHLIELTRERRVLLKNVLEAVDMVIGHSAFIINKINAYGLHPRQIRYIPYGVNFDSKSIVQIIRKQNPVLSIGYIGQIAPHKGIHILINAFKRIEPGRCKLWIHGKMDIAGSYGKNLWKLADNDPGIVFAGAYKHNEIDSVLINLDIIVVPSTWYENRPNVILEAQAYKKPVVASRLGGMLEMVRNEVDGLLFEAGNEIDLARQLERLANDPLLLSNLTANISPVKSLSQEIDEIESIYRELTHK